ncbi:MAG: FAD-binding oxidoreductase [Candidatus Kapaibacterium sp.]|jgi:FAD/FMN-containing dehydrogenase
MILKPQSREELSSILQSRTPAPLHIASAGLVEENDLQDMLAMSELNRMIAYDPREMIVRCEAGMLLKTLDRELASKGQWIPTLVAAESAELSIGAALANNIYHPRALSMTPMRTSVLGGTFSTSNGQIFRSGSFVVKSVAGYDIHRAFVGSRGLLGVIVEVTLKVLPLPERVIHLRIALEAQAAVKQFSPTVMEVDGDKLIVEISGYAEDMEADLAELSRSGFAFEEISNDSWSEALRRIRQMRSSHTRTAATDPPDSLEATLRKVFDPLGVLV